MSGEARTAKRRMSAGPLAVAYRLAQRRGLVALAVFLLAVALMLLLYQIPARHVVDIGAYDAAYVQGFYDPQSAAPTASAPPYLAGSDGSARWSRATSYLLFPQAGLPGTVTLRLRGWRANGSAPTVEVLLNGSDVLGSFVASGEWEEHRFPINGGLAKLSDLFIEIRATPASLPDDGREVGVLLDRAVYEVAPGGPILPYPTQVLLGGLAMVMGWLLTQRQPYRQRLLVCLALGVALGLAFLFLYRLQPLFYPYPLRWLLPAINLVLASLLLAQVAPRLALRFPALPLVLALGGGLLWLAALLRTAQAHLTLSVPGVEKDFSVFANRAESLETVLRADGFYNLGYPLLLWLLRPLTEGNPFLAARLIAAASGVLLLLATAWLVRSLLPRGGMLLALATLALSPLVVQYALYIGTDMPFAALLILALAAFLSATRQPKWRRALLLAAGAGLAAGAAFLMRHAGLVLLIWGLAHCLILWRTGQHSARQAAILLSVFGLGWLLASSPQLLVNITQTGQLLYNQQAKNAWLAVYANTDWGRWEEVPNSIGLSEVILRDPPRFLGNWWRNMQGFVGTGAEDTSEFGRAIQLRLLGWPANWLALAGLLGWLWSMLTARRAPERSAAAPIMASLLLFIVLYVALASIAFVLPRFFLALAPIYALAAAWALSILFARLLPVPSRETGAAPLRPAHVLVALALLALLWGGFAAGSDYVLRNQPSDEVAILRLSQATIQANERLVARVSERVPLAKYSVLAHRVLPWPSAPTEQAALDAARRQGAAYLLWDDAAGPPPLPNPATARVGGAGRYGLYRLDE